MLVVFTGLLAAAGWSTGPAGGQQQVGVGGGEVPVTANDLAEPAAFNSPELAVHPDQEQLVALAHRVDKPEFSCGLALSSDGGTSWLPADPVAVLPEGVDHCYAPQVAFGPDGTLFFLFVGLAGQGNSPAGAWLVSSSDAGRTFTQPRRVLGESNYQVRLAVDPSRGPSGRLHLVWLKVTGDATTGGLPPTDNPIMAAYSDDGGKSFSEPVRVSSEGRRRVLAPQVTADNGRVHVVYFDLNDDSRDYQGLDGPVWPQPWAVKAASSADGGQTFADPQVVDDKVRPAERVPVIFTKPPPSVAAHGGQVYATWHKATQGGDGGSGGREVFVAASPDGGQSWNDPVAAGDRQQGSDRLLPQLAVAPDGRLEVVFFERRQAPGGQLQHVGYVASTDRGRSFSVRRRLTGEASDVRTGPKFHLPTAQGSVEWGAGLALTAGPARAVAAWPDTRFGSLGTAQQDLYATTVARNASAGGRWPAPALVAALGLTAAAAAALWWRRRRQQPAMGLLAAAAAAAVLAGCAPTAGGRGGDVVLPDQPTTVQVRLDDYSFELPDRLPAGRAVFEVTNRGQQAHQLVLLRLPDDVELGQLLASSRPRVLPPTFVVPARQPGETARFAVDLEDGRYGLVCFLEDPGGQPHHRRGMHAVLQVGN